MAIGTANFIDPAAAVMVIEGLERYCVTNGIPDIRQIVGSLQVPQRGNECTRSVE